MATLPANGGAALYPFSSSMLIGPPWRSMSVPPPPAVPTPRSYGPPPGAAGRRRAVGALVTAARHAGGLRPSGPSRGAPAGSAGPTGHRSDAAPGPARPGAAAPPGAGDLTA